MSDSYHETRLAPDAKRAVVWQALWRYHFSKLIGPDDCVLDLGAGYGDFINTVQARRRIAVDLWPGLRDHAAPGVEVLITTADDLGAVADASVDYVFSSNLFEHLTRDQLTATLVELRRVLKPNGTLTTLQPNYRFAYREYFDDYTHVAVYSDRSLPDFLAANGWTVTSCRPRFLPLTVKSRFPVWPPLIAAYLASPVKPLGKQMLISARPGQ